MAVTTPAYISETGLLMVFAPSSGDLNNPITAITTNPSFYLNGSGTPMAVTGPFWKDFRKDSCLAAYRPNVPLLPTDSVTMTTVPAWATTVAGSTSAVTQQALSNRLGQSEPSMGTFGGVAYPGFDQPSSQWTLPLGMNITSGGGSTVFSNYYPFANAFHRFGTGSASIATADSLGNPITLASKMSAQFIIPNSGGFSDSRGCPIQTGVYRFFADESAPLTPMVVTLNPAGAGFSNIDILPDQFGTVTVNGTEKMWEWTVNYKLSNPASFIANLTLGIDKPVGDSFPCAWTLGTDYRFQTPGNPIKTVSNLAPDQDFVNWLTTSNGKTPEFIRWVDTIIGSNGLSTQIDPSDMLDSSAPFWNPKPTVVSVTALRPFDPAVSPYTFWSQQWKNEAGVVTTTTPGGGPSGAPNALPTSAGMLNFSGAGTGWVQVECEYDNSLYQLKSYQTIGLAGLPTVARTNGSAGTVNINLSGAFPTIFMTSPTTFVFSWSVINVSNTTGMPGNINTLVSRTLTPGGTATLSIPQGTGYEGSAYVTGQLGSGYHMNIPAGATDAFVTAAALKVFANYPSSGKVLVELSNELWSDIGSKLGMFLLGSCHALSSTLTTRAATSVIRAAQVHNLVAAAAVTAGWTGTIVRSFGSQYGNPAETTAIISTVNTYNAANPGSPIQVDAVHVAPYMPAPAYVDATLNTACSSVYAQNSSSTQLGNANPFTRSQWWDLFSHQIKYSTADNGPAGRAALTRNALSLYNPVNSQPVGFVPAMRGYEGGSQNVYTLPSAASGSSGTATGTPAAIAAMNLQLMHDLQYDPIARKFDLASYQSWQFGGFAHVNIYGLSIIRQPPNIWQIYAWAGQQPGDGSANLFFADTGQSQDFTNQSVRGKMLLDWMNVANTSPVTVGNILLESGDVLLMEDGLSGLLLESDTLTSTGSITLGTIISAGAGSSVATTVLKFENWDQVVAPATPAGWTFSAAGPPSGLSTNASGSLPIPLSSPNCIRFAAGTNLPFSIATYQTPDGVNGNVAVRGTGCFGNVSGLTNCAFSVIARGNAGVQPALVYLQSTFYEARVDLGVGGAGSLKLNSVLSGVSTNLATVSTAGSVLASNVWYQVTLTCNGTAISASLQRVSDGLWLNSSGTFQPVATTPISVFNSSITGSGLSGWGAGNQSQGFNVYGDDWTLLGSSVPTINIVINGTDSGQPFESGIDRNKWTDSFFERESSFSVASLWSLDGRLATETALTALKSTEFPLGIEQALSRITNSDTNFDNEKHEIFFTSATVTNVDITDVAAGIDGSLKVSLGSESGLGMEQTESVIAAMSISFVDQGHEDETSLLRVLWHDENVDLSREEFFTNVIIAGGVTQGALDSATAREKQFVSASIFGTDYIGILDEGTADETQKVTIVVVGYFVYSNTGVGDPINYDTPIDELHGFESTTWTTDVLAHPGDWKFGVRAFNQWGIEGNLNCEVEIILDADGNDITNMPSAPIGLRAIAILGGDIRVEWSTFPAATPGKKPTGFHVYSGIGSVDYDTPVATVLFTASFMAVFQATLTGLVDGTEYLIGVRAYNATSEEENTVTVACTSDATGPGPVVNLTGSITSIS